MSGPDVGSSPRKAEIDSILVAASGFVYAPTASINLGDEAQLTRSVERLRAEFPNSRLIAVAHSVNDEVEVDGLEVSYSAIRYLTSGISIPPIGARLPKTATQLLRVMLLLANAVRVRHGRRPFLLSSEGRAALREMAESRALYMSGAGAFNDLYMLGAGGVWGVIARCMSVLGKPVVASGQQIGPLARSSQRLLARWALRRVDLLGVRDPLSASEAQRIDVPPHRIVLTGDDAWDLAPAPEAVADATLARHRIPAGFIAAQMRFGPSVGWDQADSRPYARSLDRLSSELGLPIVFVPCATGVGADDRFAAARVREQLSVPSLSITEELGARTTKAVLGKAALAVGTANHFCVFAASMGTPVVGIHASPYMTHKIEGIASLWPDLVISFPKKAALDHSHALTATAKELLEKAVSRPDIDSHPATELSPGEPIRFLSEPWPVASGTHETGR